LKNWLFGGAHVPVGNALFDVTEYKGIIISDLFGNEQYFADADIFWQMQDNTIAAKRDSLSRQGMGGNRHSGQGQTFRRMGARKNA